MENTLTHHGILGMKWGVRRDKERSNRDKQQSEPKTKAARRRERQQQTKKSKVILLGSAAGVVGIGAGIIAVNKMIGGNLGDRLISSIPKEVVARGTKAAILTSKTSFVAGVDPTTMATVWLRGFIWNYQQNT